MIVLIAKKIEKDKTVHIYKQEMLEIYLIYINRGGKRDKILSMPMQQTFNGDYIIDQGVMMVVDDECMIGHEGAGDDGIGRRVDYFYGNIYDIVL